MHLLSVVLANNDQASVDVAKQMWVKDLLMVTISWKAEAHALHYKADAVTNWHMTCGALERVTKCVLTVSDWSAMLRF